MKKQLLKPSIYQKDIYNINYNKLKQNNIKNLIFDIDNTIASNKEKTPNNKVIELFNKLKNEGFNIYIISNALKKRALAFGNILNVKTYYLSAKPSKRSYLKLLKENNINITETAAIGDQLYTDIKGANKLGIKSILVDKIDNKEFITAKINRIKENNLINKTKIIEKGEYYD